MNFQIQRGRQGTETEINVIPFIDILLVILIFLIVTTTYQPYQALNITLPLAQTQQEIEEKDIIIFIHDDGYYELNGQKISQNHPQSLHAALLNARQALEATEKNPKVIIHASAKANYQLVITAMEAARTAGLSRLTFATRAQ